MTTCRTLCLARPIFECFLNQSRKLSPSPPYGFYPILFLFAGRFQALCTLCH